MTLPRIILLSLVVLCLLLAAATLVAIHRRRMHRWLGSYVRQSIRKRLSPAGLNVPCERRDVPRFFPRLIGSVFLCARIFQNVAQGSRK